MEEILQQQGPSKWWNWAYILVQDFLPVQQVSRNGPVSTKICEELTGLFSSVDFIESEREHLMFMEGVMHLYALGC